MIRKNNDDGKIDDIDFDEQEFDSEFLEDDLSQDVEFEDEEWDKDSNFEEEEKKSKPLKSKKSSNFNTIVIVGAFVVGALVLAFNVMSKSGEQASATGNVFQSSVGVSDVMDGGLSDAAVAAQDVVSEQRPNLPDEGQPSGFFNDTDSLANLDSPRVENSPPMPSAITSLPDDNEEGVESVVTPLPINPVQEEDVPSIMPPEIAASAEDVLKNAMAKREQKNNDALVTKDEQAVVPVLPEVINEPSPLPVQTTEILNASSKMDEKLDLILNRMDKFESDLSSIKKENANVQENLEERLSNLQNTFEGAKSEMAKKSIEKPKAKTTVEKKIAKPVAAVKKASKNPTQPKRENTPVVWELRAAQPGRAWVSKRGERDMQSVEVGQSLPNIGTIRAITYQNGLWTIVGASGNISQ